MANERADMAQFLIAWGNAYVEHPSWRLGQAAFNALHTYAPDVAEQVRGVFAADPFYRDEQIGPFLVEVNAALGGR